MAQFRITGQPGSFDALPPATKAMFVDNARTLLLNAPGDLAITCAQLEQLKIPVTITKGKLTKPSSTVITEAAHRCVHRSQLITIAEARYGASRQNPVAFNEAYLRFLGETNDAAAHDLAATRFRVTVFESESGLTKIARC